ncbi:MAG: thermonuclease family protein [Haloarculaceae archaeon]
MRLPVTAVLVALLAVLAGCGSAGLASDRTPTGTVDTPSPAGTTADPTVPDGFEPAETVEVRVTRVVDGDTLEVRFPDGSEDTVRLVGVDTPEVRVENEPGEYERVPDTDRGALCLRRAGGNATEYTAARLDGASVTLAFDPLTDRRGGYDRLLAYVYVDGTNLNHELVAAGHARVYDTEFALREAFEGSERAAQSATRGLWNCREESATNP